MLESDARMSLRFGIFLAKRFGSGHHPGERNVPLSALARQRVGQRRIAAVAEIEGHLSYPHCSGGERVIETAAGRFIDANGCRRTPKRALRCQPALSGSGLFTVAGSS